MLPFVRATLRRFILNGMMLFFGAALLMGGSAHSRAATGSTIAIAAASDLVFCLQELNAAFNDTHPDATLKVANGSSGQFFAQIENGAPFDVFLSADIKYPKKLVESHKAESGSLYVYAIGRLVLWTRDPNVLVTNGLGVLQTAAVKKFAIADPAHAPYGAAARAALEAAGIWEAVQPKLVLGENIAQTFQYIHTGNVEAGLVALSLVSAPALKGRGSYWLVPEQDHPRLEQAAVLTLRGAQNPLAKAYMDFLRSDKARGILNRYGFQSPGK